ncbi:GspE/PulE family protein [Methylophilus aquaticus]|uniref:GspE/PulE family protein n=1 Tax=Methylophilus aquaticus TaxID=1971610 RepID=A0ABT9JUD2_9PROT|nr:GspE/PulE family protein [Methylophilus aquaticus]MDP8568188.1 GspE/PulE family protein [Methylophilus aquaticus]
MALHVKLLADAQVQAQQQQRRPIEVLEDMLALEPDAMVAALASLLNYQQATMRDLRAWQVAFEVITYNQAQQKECLAFYDEAQSLVLVFADPFNRQLPLWVQHAVTQPFQWRLAHRLDINAYLAGEEETMRAMDGVGLPEAGAQDGDEEPVTQLSLKSIHEDANPIIKLINSTLYDALKTGASDIHLESHPGGLAVKYRIDGVMASIANSPGLDSAEQAISRIKVMAQLDIAERRIPQDGRFKVNTMGRLVDFRVSIMPSAFGEDAVLRVLDRKALTEQAQGLSLKALGFDAEVIAKFRKLASEPYGMVLVTGPTGSGKTTSLYAAISEVNTGFDKIITIEDPVEYQLPGVLQIPVNEKKGLTFARGLRSILRHDPDKIMVGEIRDGETAQIAVQAALTGHLVFSTVHANSVLDVIGRFMHMGVDPYHFVSAVNGIIAQRLVRALCPHCAEPFTPDAALLEDSGITAEQGQAMTFLHAKGCGHCRGTGYKGRKAVAEMLVLNDELREMIIAREPIRKLKEAAARNGMRTIREAAISAVAEGMTSLQEINRVTFVA